MALTAQKKDVIAAQEDKLYRELDKGIDDMEHGRTLPHDEAMKLIRDRIKEYAI